VAVDPTNRANEILAKLPGRRTRGRTAVLSSLIESGVALTHTEIENLLPPEIALDRVTLYRILDWLAEHAVVHRVSGADRAVRYAFSDPAQSTSSATPTHAHYQCGDCGRVGCLDGKSAFAPLLAPTMTLKSVDILVHVSCTQDACPHRPNGK
jgi:Fur family transcriptional regulator, ferric uptake regulator